MKKSLLSIAFTLGVLSIVVGISEPVLGSQLKQGPALQAVQITAAAPDDPQLFNPVSAPKISAQVQPGGSVPEPGNFALFGTGLLALAILLRWKMNGVIKGRDTMHQRLSLITDKDLAGEKSDGSLRVEPKPMQSVTFATPDKVHGKAAGGNAA
jgi:hypothetical protein